MGDPFAPDSVVLRNLKAAMFLKRREDFEERATSVATLGNMIAVGTQKLGCRIYRYRVQNKHIQLVIQRGPRIVSRKPDRIPLGSMHAFNMIRVTGDLSAGHLNF